MVKVNVGGKCYYMDGYLKNNLDLAKSVIKKDWDFIFVYDGYEGCLTGDTIIRNNRASLGRQHTIEYIYNQYHNNPDNLYRLRKWDLNIPTFVRSFDGNTIRLHKIQDVKYSGIKEVFNLILDDDYSIKATRDHKIMTNNGWIMLKDLDKTKHKVMIDNPHAQKVKNHKHKFHDIQLGGLKHHPYGKDGKRIEVHRIIYEAYLNNLSFTDYIDVLMNDSKRSTGFKYVNPSVYCIHHIDGNHYNNNLENLKCLTHDEHLKLNSNLLYSNFNQGIPSFKTIKEVKPSGFEKTYDIICDKPHHNFVANGIVVHNSGKSLKAQQDAFYCDPTLDINRVTFTPTEFQKAIVNAKPYQSVIFDEAYGGLASRSANSRINKALVTVLAEIRQKNLFIFIVLPSFFDLDKYVALWRSRVLIHVYCGDNFERGNFSFFNQAKKKDLYVYGKKFYNYKQTLPNFRGRFTKFYTVDEVAYKKKKLDSLTSNELEKATLNVPLIRNGLMNDLFLRLVNMEGITNEKKANIMGISRRKYQARLATHKSKAEDLIKNDGFKPKSDSKKSYFGGMPRVTRGTETGGITS